MYNNIRLEKGLYSITGKTFTQALAELDPDANYENTELKGLDAFERQLKRFDIKVKGASSDRVEKFFLSTESAVLFPEYVRRTIKQGMDESSIMGKVAAAVTYTDGIDFRGLTVTKGGNSDTVKEGGTMPVTTVRLASANKTLTKFARRLSCSYESIRKQRLEAFGVILKNLGAAISRDVNGLAMTEITNGVTPMTIAGNDLAYSDLAAFWASMSDCNMTTMVCTPDVMAKILAMDEMKYCVGDYMSGGTVQTPYGVTLVKCPQLTGDIAVGIDQSCAVEMVLGTDIVVDFDQLISTQCNEISCSIMVGFSTLTSGAVKTLKTVKS
ncbi:hypothetical protein [Ruminococcus sp.]|uniref:phage major capsid protein n=1 Tax=Ruminococcus sp. TaxID=41978 RepID=UPI0025D6368F|nr:hypothetical protein [Ruminococcus sp.]